MTPDSKVVNRLGLISDYWRISASSADAMLGPRCPPVRLMPRSYLSSADLHMARCHTVPLSLFYQKGDTSYFLYTVQRVAVYAFPGNHINQKMDDR